MYKLLLAISLLLLGAQASYSASILLPHRFTPIYNINFVTCVEISDEVYIRLYKISSGRTKEETLAFLRPLLEKTSPSFKSLVILKVNLIYSEDGTFKENIDMLFYTCLENQMRR